MTQEEYIDLLNRELKELGDLLAGMSECDTIPAVFLTMARDKALRMAEGFEKLSDMGKKPAPEKAVVSPAVPTQSETRSGSQVNLFKSKPVTTQSEVKKVSVVPDSLSVDTPVLIAEEQQVMNCSSEETPADMPVETEPMKVEQMQVKEVFEPVFRQFTQVPSQSAAKNDIRSLMTLNDRFLFQRELFRGDIGLLNYTLNEVNKCASMNEAIAFLEREYKWDPEATGVKEFLELLERHFEGTII